MRRRRGGRASPGRFAARGGDRLADHFAATAGATGAQTTLVRSA